MQVFFLILLAITIFIVKQFAYKYKRKLRRDYYRNVYLKSEEWQRKRHVIFKRDNWLCVYCGLKATQIHHKDMQNTILVKSLLNGLFQYVNLVTTNNIVDNLKFLTHNRHFCKKWIKYSTDASVVTQKLNKGI